MDPSLFSSGHLTRRNAQDRPLDGQDHGNGERRFPHSSMIVFPAPTCPPMALVMVVFAINRLQALPQNNYISRKPEVFAIHLPPSFNRPEVVFKYLSIQYLHQN